VVIAGRNPPAPAWRTDIDWADRTQVVELGNLHPDESRTYLVARGIPDEQHADVLAFTHGHLHNSGSILSSSHARLQI